MASRVQEGGAGGPVGSSAGRSKFVKKADKVVSKYMKGREKESSKAVKDAVKADKKKAPAATPKSHVKVIPKMDTDLKNHANNEATTMAARRKSGEIARTSAKRQEVWQSADRAHMARKGVVPKVVKISTSPKKFK